jgi:hypothetical protein
MVLCINSFATVGEAFSIVYAVREVPDEKTVY